MARRLMAAKAEIRDVRLASSSGGKGGVSGCPHPFHESSPIVPGPLGARNLPLPIGAYLPHPR
ncbi:hypothetical protein DP44_5605 [Burkholderia pseudomallei]|nr:hypothetical protein DP44_5605 [Burkholderia pseudomallei]